MVAMLKSDSKQQTLTVCKRRVRVIGMRKTVLDGRIFLMLFLHIDNSIIYIIFCYPNESHQIKDGHCYNKYIV